MPPSAVSRVVAMALVAGGMGAAHASTVARTQSGTTAEGIAWTARSTLVGAGSTATQVGGGLAEYMVPPPRSGGVVALTIGFGASTSTCTGTLLSDRRSILTAAHCVTDDALALPETTVAHFHGGTDPDTRVPVSPVATTVNVDRVRVHAGYTGNVIDHNDIAVLRLADAAPSFAPAFDLYTDDLAGKNFTVMGYGMRSSVGGSLGAHLDGGRLRQGENRFDFRMGDPVFGGGWAPLAGVSLAQVAHSWLADFDSGRASNDLSCRSVRAEFGLAANAAWCDLGRGVMEAGLAPGDSGGPSFIDGRIAAVSSYGLTFDAPGYGDVDAILNSSFGEFSGYVPVYLHADFITAAMVPEPSQVALVIAGLVVVMGAVSRQRA